MPSFPRLLLASCVACVSLAPCAAAPAVPDPGMLATPGRLSDLAAAVGIDRPLPRARVLLEIIRAVYARPADPARPDPASLPSRLAHYLAGVRQLQASARAAGLSGSTPGLSDTAPQPIPADAWRAILGRNVPDEGLCGAILGDRRAALLYYGLASLDEPTRLALAGQRALLTRIYAEHAGSFATLARSLRIENGRLVTPGGAAAAAMWARLVGESPSRPPQFIEHLFRRDDSRLAYFYDTLAHLDPAGLAFATSAAEADAGARFDRFARLYRAFEPTLRTWQPELRPFYRITGDAADLLLRLRVTPDGRLASPASRGLWEAAFEAADLSAPAVRGALGPYGADPIPVDRLVELVCVPEINIRFDRVRAVLFAQHAFAGATPADAPDVLAAVRGAPRFWSLVVTLDRMAITQPALYAAAVRHAAALNAIEDQSRRAVATSQFQGALALLERARFARTLDVGSASRLASQLMALPLTDGRYHGGVAQWLDAHVLPALAAITGAGGDALLAAMAGRRATPPVAPAFVWEEVTYRVDVAAGEFARLSTIARAQLPQPTEVVLSFSRVARHAAAVPQPQDFALLLPGLLKVSGEFHAPQAIGLGSGPPLALPGDVVKSVLSAARAAARPGPHDTPPNVRLIAQPLLDEADALLAEALAALAYIPALGEPDGPSLFVGHVSAQHDLLLGRTNTADTQARGPWQLPEEVSNAGQPWHIRGSLLGMDLALARLALRRLGTDRLPPPPSIATNDARALAEAVALCNPFTLSDAGRDRIVAAVSRGRERLAQLSARPDAPTALAELGRVTGAGEWRIEAVAWSARHAPEEVPQFFPLSDLLRVGSTGSQDASELDAWGASGPAWNGLAFSQFPPAGAWETYAGRPGTAMLAARLPDPAIRVAEVLADRHLPATLARGILATAMQDFLDDVRLAHPDDWLSAAMQIATLPGERFDDYVAALTWNGPLIAAPRGLGHER